MANDVIYQAEMCGQPITRDGEICTQQIGTLNN